VLHTVDIVSCFNYLQGGEPARLKLSHWHDACNKVWFDQSRIQEMTSKEQQPFHKSYIMYEEGKGINHHVPVIVPDDTVAALHKLSDPVC